MKLSVGLYILFPVLTITITNLYSVVSTKKSSTNTTKLYSKNFDYMSNGVLKGVANDEVVFEISPSSLVKADLATLLNWIQWLDDMKVQIQNLAENHEYACHCYIRVDKLTGDNNKEKRIEIMLRALKYYQEKMEEELRKPEKSWNYPLSSE